jgi:putative transcriptional regulator
MTVQGASDYAKGLEVDGLLTTVGGEYRATKKGIGFLQGRIRELRAFVEQARLSMAFVETTAAFAGASIHRGDRVGLFMERGQLVAYPDRPSPSMGVAGEDAGKGEDVAVRDLEGIVALRPGRITLLRVPSIRSGGAKAIDAARARRILRKVKSAVVAGMDVQGPVAARLLGLAPRIEFGVLPAVLDAAERGVDVVLFVPEERAADAVQAIEATNAKLEDKISYESLALG